MSSSEPIRQDPYHYQGQAAGTDGLAVASFVLGLLGIVPVSVGLGIAALVRGRGVPRPGRGFAVAGLVLSAVWVLLFVGLGVVGYLAFEHTTTVTTTLEPG